MSRFMGTCTMIITVVSSINYIMGDIARAIYCLLGSIVIILWNIANNQERKMRK